MEANLTTASNDSIAALIHSELTGYQTLLELLTEERHLLVKRDFDAFIVLLGNKNDLLQTLEYNNEQRTRLLEEKNLPINKQGMLALFDTLPDIPSRMVRQDWDQLNVMLKRCTELNEINARIAHRAQATTHQMLNILRGDPDGFSLYGKKGTRDEHSKPLPITRV